MGMEQPLRETDEMTGSTTQGAAATDKSPCEPRHLGLKLRRAIQYSWTGEGKKERHTRSSSLFSFSSPSVKKWPPEESQPKAMLTLHAQKAVSGCWLNGDAKISTQAALCNIVHVNFLSSNVVGQSSLRNPCNQRLYTSFGSSIWCSRAKTKIHCVSKISNQATLKQWLCRLHICASSDDEYRSSRNIATSLFRRYRNVIDRGGGDNLKEYISAAVNAYALGCTDEGLRKELMDMKDSGIEIESMETYGGSTSLKSKIFSEEVNECILWLSITFITILCTPQPTVVRWSSTPPVSDEIRLQWNGFCALIANAYYIKGMAWLPVKTLQLEQMAVVGSAEEPSVVAGRMRLVFSTLEVVSPQWPRV
ncbi:uncharacterized protein LOC131221251 isoform X2 [Magnolia sinica]|uniref:uncharacterized protein LOC131221251 isoform X2 n=1 Tax=Magnolia sinica TaxID=86752 RepID=UPI002659FCB5|nr:uncharacterized protein LOC131221251 isoform X2 [Magnolia sinica]